MHEPVPGDRQRFAIVCRRRQQRRRWVRRGHATCWPPGLERRGAVDRSRRRGSAPSRAATWRSPNGWACRCTARPSQARLRRALRGAEVVIDALFGTGFRGAPRPAAATLIDSISGRRTAGGGAGHPVRCGCVRPAPWPATAVAAELTVAFHGPKLGLIVAPGMPPRRRRWSWPTSGSRRSWSRRPGRRWQRATLIDLVPRKASSGRRSTGPGRCWWWAGPRACRGRRCWRRGRRCGRGRASPGWRWSGIGGRPGRRRAARADGARPAGRPRPGATAPGRWRSAPAWAAAPRRRESFAASRQRHRGPLVIDADGLFALAGKLEPPTARRRTPAVLTPHEGEMARLLGREPDWVASNRLAAVREAAAASRGGGAAEGRRHPGRRTPAAIGSWCRLGHARGLATAGSGRRPHRGRGRDAGEGAGSAGRRRAAAPSCTRGRGGWPPMRSVRMGSPAST